MNPPGGDAGTVRLALLGTETARQKADKLADEFTNKRIAFTRDAATMTNFTFPTTVTGVTVDNKTKQRMILETAGLAPGNAQIDYFGTLSGQDLIGMESTYQAELGFTLLIDGGALPVFSSGSLSFSQLPGPSIDDLLLTMFTDLRADLPASLQPLLSLNLAAQAIVFSYPSNTVDVSLRNFSSDLTTDPSMALNEVPEPIHSCSSPRDSVYRRADSGAAFPADNRIACPACGTQQDLTTVRHPAWFPEFRLHALRRWQG